MSAGGLQLRVEYIRRGAVQLLVGIVMFVFRMPLFLFNYLNGAIIPAHWTGMNSFLTSPVTVMYYLFVLYTIVMVILIIVGIVNLVVGAIPVKKV
jgi:hypothetical protein